MHQQRRREHERRQQAQCVGVKRHEREQAERKSAKRKARNEE
jgi:hypothetical protein